MANKEEVAPMLVGMQEPARGLAHLEDTPAYRTLLQANLLTTAHRKRCFNDIFVGVDLKANSSKYNDCVQKCKSCYFCPVIGCFIYKSTHIEMFVPAGHV